jgi:hypothetical protein
LTFVLKPSTAPLRSEEVRERESELDGGIVGRLKEIEVLVEFLRRLRRMIGEKESI